MQKKKKILIMLFCVMFVMGLMSTVCFGADDEAYNENDYLNKKSINNAISYSNTYYSIAKLAKDVTLSENITVAGTLNLNGYSLKIDSAKSASNVTFTGNGNIEISAGTFSGITINNNNTKKISGGTFTNGSYYGVTISGGTFSGGTFSGVTITGGTFNSGTYSFTNATIAGTGITFNGTYTFEGTTSISGTKNTFNSNTKFNGYTTITDTGDDNLFNGSEFNNITQIIGDNNLFNSTTKFQNSGTVTISGTGNVFDDDTFSKETEITGTGNKFNNTKFTSKTTINGNSNSFSNATSFNNVAINSNSNTFDSVKFTAGNTATIKGKSNTVKSGTVFNGTAKIENGADGNVFNGVNFGSTSVLKVEGNSYFVKGTESDKGIISGNATINSGEFDNIKFSGASKTIEINGGEFENGLFENETVKIYGGNFESDSVTEQPSIELTKRLVFDNCNVTIANKTGITDANIDGAVFDVDSKLTIAGTCKLINPVYQNKPKDITRQNIVGLDNNSYTEIYYKTIGEAIKDIPDNNYPKTITLYDYNKPDSDDIIPGSKRVILDLNGGKINKITNYGDLTIVDSTNTFKSGVVKLPEGKVNSITNSGKLLIKSGRFTPLNFSNSLKQLDTYVYKSPEGLFLPDSYSYYLNDEFFVIENGNLEYNLKFEVYDSMGNVVKSIDEDNIQDVVVGEKYKMKIYIKSENDYPVQLDGYSIKAYFDNVGKIEIETPYSDDNNYTSVDYDEENGIMDYKLDNEIYVIPKNSESESDMGFQVAQFYFTVKKDASEPVQSGTKINFDFFLAENTVEEIDILNQSTVSVMNGINNVLVRSGETKTVNAITEKEGIVSTDFRYAPEDHVLAIIFKELDDNQIIQFGDEKPKGDENRLYYTDRQSYIDESTNPNAKGVFIGLININTLISKGYLADEDKNDSEKIADAVDKSLKKVEGNKKKDEENSVYLDFNYDLDDDGQVDYNDASLLYKMIIEGGISWSIDENNIGNYLGARARLISLAGEKAKFYGTIEDVANIINHYGPVSD